MGTQNKNILVKILPVESDGKPARFKGDINYTNYLKACVMESDDWCTKDEIVYFVANAARYLEAKTFDFLDAEADYAFVHFDQIAYIK